MAEDLTIDVLPELVPAATVEIRGISVAVYPIVAKQFSAMAKHVKPLMAVGVNLLTGNAFSDDAANAIDAEAILDLVEHHSDDLIAAITLCTNKSADWIGHLLPNEITELAIASWTANSNFFSKTLESIAKAIEAKTPGVDAETA